MGKMAENLKRREDKSVDYSKLSNRICNATTTPTYKLCTTHALSGQNLIWKVLRDYRIHIKAHYIIPNFKHFSFHEGVDRDKEERGRFQAQHFQKKCRKIEAVILPQLLSASNWKEKLIFTLQRAHTHTHCQNINLNSSSQQRQQRIS